MGVGSPMGNYFRELQL